MELRLKCDRAPRFNGEMHRSFQIKAIKYSVHHLHVQSRQKINTVSNRFKVNNKDTRKMSGASVVNFEHILHVTVLLILLSLNKLMTAGPEKQQFQTITFFSITVKNTHFMGYKNLLEYMISSLFIQHKVANGQSFMTLPQKDESNPAIVYSFNGNLNFLHRQNRFFFLLIEINSVQG